MKTRQTKNKTKTLVECALLIAVATALSLFPIVELPYGGSVTLASMLPLLLVAYRHGVAWGVGTGLAYGVLQQLLGLKYLGYFTTWQSILAIVFLDYLVAFAALGIGGVFRRVVKRQNRALAAGALLGGFLRYLCHVISGATVWAGISIPTKAALLYSFAYNATYMVPETLVLLLAAYYLGSVLDLRGERPKRLASERDAVRGGAKAWNAAACFVLVAGAIADVALIFSHLQDPETGEFSVTALRVERFAGSFLMAAAIVTACAALLSLALCLIGRKRKG